jgi:hypothetical protein
MQLNRRTETNSKLKKERSNIKRSALKPSVMAGNQIISGTNMANFQEQGVQQNYENYNNQG